ncbi:DUF2851 family protein [Brumimicrobium oceani]|uniref:DUF2851 domain-containing protein n=1 Tax=Brumimicrobium oceani TaxID=2100725 RepID=A0A2U2XDP7_9FLAO|nr:DUF2851 family protein [Brumimicrobium oceani]PWH85903.1 hypothetical protein DIT68_07375 [Brumimicrobium oceani]
MQEEYLHYLWRMKRLNFNLLKLTNGVPINIHEIGWYNLDSGPDFFNGTVSIDGLKWSGNIELHIKSSDWYAHNHHLDEAYNNVVLHVVYEHDKEVFVNGVLLPTIELKSQIDMIHFSNYQKILSNPQRVPCAHVVKNYKLALLQQIDVSFLHRIERKGIELIEMLNLEKRDKYSLLLAAILQATGGRVNKLPMQELAKILPYQLITKEQWDKTRLEALVFGSAGFLKEDFADEYYKSLQHTWTFLKHKHSLLEMNKSAWKFSGIRPYSFPSFILAQINAFLLQFDLRSLTDLTAKQIIDQINKLSTSYIDVYWENHFVFGKQSKQRTLSFSKQFKQNLIINGVVPYFVSLKHLYNDFSYSDIAVELMEKLPSEKNNVVNYWQNIGFSPQNALESQGLLELNNEFCKFKKCLSCKVGTENLEK